MQDFLSKIKYLLPLFHGILKVFRGIILPTHLRDDPKDFYKCQERNWIYRGQRDTKKGLKTTLERACENYGDPSNKWKKNEEKLLREFQRKYHHYSAYLPYKKNTLEWLSLMQHHGAPTRLLDFTYSFYVAAYFALEEADNDCAVWAINHRWAVEKSKNKFKKGTAAWKFLDEFIEEEKEKVFKTVFMRSRPKTFTCPQNPFRLNERLTIQKGVFMVPGNVSLSFEKNLRTMGEWDRKENIKKIIIPRAFKKEALDILYDMNITRATLFPGLDGFAHSLKVSLPKRWEYSR